MKTFKYEFTEEEKNTILSALSNRVLFCSDKRDAAISEGNKIAWDDMQKDANTLHRLIRSRPSV